MSLRSISGLPHCKRSDILCPKMWPTEKRSFWLHIQLWEANLLGETLGPFIRGKIRRELYHLYEHVLSNKTRLILDEMCRLYGKFASYLRLVLCKTRLIFPRINGPTVYILI